MEIIIKQIWKNQDAEAFVIMVTKTDAGFFVDTTSETTNGGAIGDQEFSHTFLGMKSFLDGMEAALRGTGYKKSYSE